MEKYVPGKSSQFGEWLNGKTLLKNPDKLYRLGMHWYSLYRLDTKAYTYPSRVFMENTTICNIKCKMCPSKEINRKRGHLSFANAKKIIDSTRPLYLCIVGLGEPFTNKDTIEMIRYAKSKNIFVKLATNATLIDEKLANDLVSSGLDLLSLSIDGATKEIYEGIRTGANFEKVMNNIRILTQIKEKRRKENFPTPIIRTNTLLQVSNFIEVPKMVELFHDLGVDVIDFNNVLGYDDITENFRLTYRNPEDINIDSIKKQFNDGIKRCEELGRIETAKSLQRNLNNIIKTSGKKNDSSSFLCLHPWNSTYVSWEGDIYPCPCGQTPDPLTIFGNLFEEKFIDIWNNKKYQNFRKDVIENKNKYYACRKCTVNNLGIYNFVESTSRYIPFSRFLRGKVHLPVETYLQHEESDVCDVN